MEPKPLTKRDRDKYAELVTVLSDRYDRDMLEELLAAEQFWREAVQNSGDCFYDSAWECRFCHARSDSIDENFNDIEEELIRSRLKHDPTCAWLLAKYHEKPDQSAV